MKIEPERYLFSKIECRDYDILLPFSCRKTGSCCSVYVPRIPYEHLVVLAKYLGQPVESFIADYQCHYGKRLKGQPVRCPFLDNHNLCEIYYHSLRPWVCHLFPFSYSGEVINNMPGPCGTSPANRLSRGGKKRMDDLRFELLSQARFSLHPGGKMVVYFKEISIHSFPSGGGSGFCRFQ